jgi:hypothetical protein
MSLANFKKEYLDFFNCFEKIIKWLKYVLYAVKIYLFGPKD